MASQPGDDIAEEVAKTFGLQNSGWAEGGGLLNNILGLLGSKAKGATNPQTKAQPPPLNKPLPRIVPDGKGNLIDLNTNQIVGKDDRQSQASPNQTPQQPGSGLMNDVVGFLQEGLRNAGQKAKESTDARSKLFDAIRSGQKADLGPLMRDAMAGSQPMAGQISPGAWAASSPQTRALTNMLADKFPDFMTKLLKHPRDFVSWIAEQSGESMAPGMSSIGEYSNLGPKAGKITLAPFSPDKAQDMTSVIAHEFQHGLNTNSPLLNTAISSPDNQETAATLIHSILPRGGRGSLEMRLNQLQDLKSGVIPNELKDLHANIGTEGLKKSLQKSALDEALAHLTENTSRPGASGNLLDMSNLTGTGVGKESY